MATLLLAHNCKSPRIFFNSFAPLVSTLSAAHGACDGNTRSSWLWVQQQFRQQQYATAAADAQQGVPLKTALRQLYKRVHPDLFTDYPAEQAENERSFKLLQEYLHQARRPTTGPTSRTAYHFRFYLMPQHTDQAADEAADIRSGSDESTAAGDDPAGPSFHLVQLSLAPPQPHRGAAAATAAAAAGRGGGGQLSAAAGKALRRLLELCGINGVVADATEQEDTSSKLTTFIPEAAEFVRQHESGPARHEVRVANIRAAIRLARQVIAGFQPEMFTGEQQVELLQRLTRALDQLLVDDESDVNLSGLHILITNRTCLNSQGTLCLDAADSAEEWADFLGGVDLDYARDKKSSAGAVRQLEGQVAAAVGVRMLFTAASYLMTHEYRQFLERLAAHAAAHGQVQLTRYSSRTGSDTATYMTFSNISVYVAPPYLYQQATQQPQQQQQSIVHEVMGYIMVDMNDSAVQVYHTLQAHGRPAAKILAHKQQQQQELAELTSSVRSRLNIRRLFKDELISTDEFKSACKRLLYHRDMLLRCNIEGLSIRVSDKNRVAPDGSLVEVAWNFDM